MDATAGKDRVTIPVSTQPQKLAEQHRREGQQHQGHQQVEERNAVAQMEPLGQSGQKAQGPAAGPLGAAADIGNIVDRVVIDDVVQHAVAIGRGGGDQSGDKGPPDVRIPQKRF